MAYKFQMGDARLSGSVRQEGQLRAEDTIRGDGIISASSDLYGMALRISGAVVLDSSQNITVNTLTANGIVQLPGTVDTALDVSADSVYFLDGDGTLKRDTFADLATAQAGAGMTATAGALNVIAGSLIDVTADAVDVDLSEAAAATIATGDNLIFLDGGATGAASKGSTTDLVSMMVGVAADTGLSDAGSSVMKVDLNALTAAAIASGDSLAFVDSNDSNNLKKESIDDIATLFAGVGLSAASAVLALDLNELGAAAVDIQNDSVAFIDATDNTSKKESWGDVTTAMASQANGGIDVEATTKKFILQLSELSAATVDPAADSLAIVDANDGSASRQESVADFVTAITDTTMAVASGVAGVAINRENQLQAAAIDVASDSILIVDANDSNNSKKEAWADVVAAIAGGGLTATAGVLSTDAGGTPTQAVNGTQLSEGYNFLTGALIGSITVSLPNAPSTGDVVHLKAHDVNAGKNITIARSGSHTIDGLTSAVLESGYGAVSFVYVDNNDWRIV